MVIGTTKSCRSLNLESGNLFLNDALAATIAVGVLTRQSVAIRVLRPHLVSRDSDSIAQQSKTYIVIRQSCKLASSSDWLRDVGSTIVLASGFDKEKYEENG